MKQGMGDMRICMNEKKDKTIIRYHDGIRVGEVLNHG